MSKCICTLEPKAIWENFYKLTQVPRPSNHEEKAREFVMNWAKENGIHAEMDEANNILLSKPATPGMENRKGVILQGHLDMVPQKNEDNQHTIRLLFQSQDLTRCLLLTSCGGFRLPRPFRFLR